MTDSFSSSISSTPPYGGAHGEPDSSTDEAGSPGDHHSIGEVLALLQADFPDVSISKIRFLESRGLVTPHRAPSGYRKFVETDIERLRWILTMQRDQFLPLRVIKERLDAGPVDHVDTDPHNDSVLAEPARPATARFRTPAPGVDDIEPSDLARLAGMSADQLDQLAQFGLVEAHETGDGPRFSRDELQVAKAAAAFMRHGIEARHLKAWRIAAEREAGMLEQILLPVISQAGPSSQRAREVADDLIDMGNTIREAIIVKSLRQALGLTSD